MEQTLILYGRDTTGAISPLQLTTSAGQATVNYGFLFPSQITTTQSTGHTAIPSGTTSIYIQFNAGGGGGGYYGGSSDHGGGGGGSETCYVWLKSTDISTNSHIYVSIGNGGAGGSIAVPDGSAGGTTTVRFSNGSSTSGTIIGTAIGGGGGTNGNNFARGGNGGSGGTVTTGVGYHIPGDIGMAGYDAGTAIQNPSGGDGGSSKLGRGGQGAFDTSGGDAIAGNRGGGGGGGVLGSDASIIRASASGGTGIVIMMFYGSA